METCDNKVLPRLPLRFKSRNVRLFEEKNGPLTNYIDSSIGGIIKLIQVGNGLCDEETADEILDNYLEQGGDILEASLQISEVLQKGGFIPRRISLEMARKSAYEQMEKLDLGEETMETES